MFRKLEKYNELLDDFVRRIGLKKKAPCELTVLLPQLIQSLILNIHSGLTLENAIQLAIKNINLPEDLKRQIHVHQSGVLGLTFYAQIVNDEKIWRLIRLLEIGHKTGGINLSFALEKYNDTLWSERLTELKKESEKISIQLTFLLMLSLISIIVIAISPIILTL